MLKYIRNNKMSLSKEQKQKILSKNQLHKNDTGSANVQVSFLSEQIKYLSDHLKKNLKDIVARRILLKKVAYKKKLVKQLKN